MYITYILLKYNALDEFGTLARFVYIVTDFVRD